MHDLEVLTSARDAPWKLTRSLRRIVSHPFVVTRLRIAGVQVGSGGRFFGTPTVWRYRGSVIELGADVILRSWRKSNVLGLSHAVILATTSTRASIRIGNGVGISGASICSDQAVEIGDRTLIGADVLITDTDHHPLPGRPVAESKPIRIGADVFIGARAIVLKGSTIGDGAIIGAGAVIAGDVPPYSVAVGNPARIHQAEPAGLP